MPYDAKREFRRRRVPLGLEMKDLAPQVPISYSALRGFEVGASPLKEELIYRLAALVGIAPAEVPALISDTPTNARTAA